MKMNFKQICKKCNGKCCHGRIFLGAVDVEKLKSAGKKIKIRKAGKAGFDLISDGKCPFFKEKIGCTLEEGLKPIDCTLYPLAFLENSERFTFYLNKRCPYYKQVPKDWIEKTKTWAQKKLKAWSKEEREIYIKRQINDFAPIK